MAEVTAIAEHQTYQGIAAVSSTGWAAARAGREVGTGRVPAILKISDIKNYTLGA
jgi:hypothetical protein